MRFFPDCPMKFLCSKTNYNILFLDSSAVEHPAVNRRVVGSNPTRGAYTVP